MDLAIFQAVHLLVGRADLLDTAAVFFSRYLPYFLVAGALWFIFRQESRPKKIFVLIFIAFTLILSRGIITETIRFFYDRSRPFEILGFEPLIVDTNPSFPSGHAAFFFALAIGIFSFNKKWGWWFLGLALLNSLARIFVGLHWPSDILGGIVVALISFLAVDRLVKKTQ